MHHHLFARYGSSTPGQMVTVSSLLGDEDTSPPSLDGFAYLGGEMTEEFFEINDRLRSAGKVFTGVIAL